jgi:transcription termination factor Rho
MDESGSIDADGERVGTRRRRSRRGRQPESREDDYTEEVSSAQPVMIEDPTPSPQSEQGPEDHPLSVPPEAAGTLSERDDVRPAQDPSGYRTTGSQRRDGNDYVAPSDGREPRPTGPYDRNNRPDSRNRRDWREQPDPREQRDGLRQAPRDRQQPIRERGFVGGRDSQRNGGAPRDGQPYRDTRDNTGYREPAGYREAPSPAPPRERVPETGPAPRLAEVVMRGYVISVDQNQTQWQLRTHGHLPSPQDATISLPVVRANDLRMGDEIVGLVRSAAPGRRFGELLDVQSINGLAIDHVTARPRFDDLTPIYPERHMRLERPDSITARLIDIVCPVGFGQRAMIVSPPKAGKTTILKEIGHSINVNYPLVKLIVCLVGERPEEVTDLAKSLQGEVISSTFDEAISHHTELAEITIERARRLVESGFDVVVLLDSVTRLARAYNLSAPGDSRSLSGGMATTALYPPKRFFGAARALEEGGSLTVIATCLVDTNSRLDDVIYEELKGTGNMELVLDRRLAEERVFPAIDIVKSSTRREELLLQPNELTAVTRLRRALAMGNDQVNNTQRIIQQMERTRTNAEFLASLLTQSSAR